MKILNKEIFLMYVLFIILINTALMFVISKSIEKKNKVFLENQIIVEVPKNVKPSFGG